MYLPCVRVVIRLDLLNRPANIVRMCRCQCALIWIFHICTFDYMPPTWCCCLFLLLLLSLSTESWNFKCRFFNTNTLIQVKVNFFFLATPTSEIRAAFIFIVIIDKNDNPTTVSHLWIHQSYNCWYCFYLELIAVFLLVKFDRKTIENELNHSFILLENQIKSL